MGYGIIEAWCNHLAFVLDEEPRFSEYPNLLSPATPRSIYTVENECTLERCDQLPFTANDSFKAVIVFGGLLWELHKRVGAAESATLTLDSVGLLDLARPVDYSVATHALISADLMRGGRNADFLRARARARRLVD